MKITDDIVLDYDKLKDLELVYINLPLNYKEREKTIKDRMIDIVKRHELVKMSDEKVSIPDGKYTALWSGWELKFSDICVQTIVGIRGTSIETVIVRDGYIYKYAWIK